MSISNSKGLREIEEVTFFQDQKRKKVIKVGSFVMILGPEGSTSIMRGILVALCALLAVSAAMVIISNEGRDTPHYLGAKACTWGPTYWCTNLTTAAGCHNAVKYCIPHVWNKMTVPEDNDSVCNICKDMVKQARDQLESNQTQEDLKAVFEGSCALMYIKPIVKMCDKLVDDFVPELVETLASQMDPSVVCSVSGLCNSAAIDRLLLEHQQDKQKASAVEIQGVEDLTFDECSKCYSIATHIENKFVSQSRDNVLNQFLNVCGELSSFSDACSSLVLVHFENIYSHINKNLNAKNICHLAGTCANRYHVHEDKDKVPQVEIRPLSSVGKVNVGDDLPCKLCEQLVGHLRDLLVANTTEIEFEQVMEGFCKQMGSFAHECKSIVDQYYPQIYEFLTKGLNKNVVCQMAGICPAPGKTQKVTPPLWPLLSNEARMGIVGKNEEIDRVQLPLEMLDLSGMDQKDCTSCEFFVNQLKKNINDPNDREHIESMLQGLKSMPIVQSQPELAKFLDKYDVAMLELIAEGKDYSEICGLMATCPTSQQLAVWERIPESFKQTSLTKDKPNCPLCLLAMTELYDVIKNNKTEGNIESALDKLCYKLPKNLNSQCADLVKDYSKQIISKILQNVSPQEVCVYIKLCDPTTITEIPQHIKEKESKPNCPICLYVMSELYKIIKNDKTEAAIERGLDEVCTLLPGRLSSQCVDLVKGYSREIIALMISDMEPEEVCATLKLCDPKHLQAERPLFEQIMAVPTLDTVEGKETCALCEYILHAVQQIVTNPKAEDEVKDALDKVCKILPHSIINNCNQFVEEYGDAVVSIIAQEIDPTEICPMIHLCPGKAVQILEESEVKDKPNCPLCLFGVTQIYNVIKDNKTEVSIQHALDNLCTHLSHNLVKQCEVMVDQFSKQIIESLVADFTPQEVCVYLQLCDAPKSQKKDEVIIIFAPDKEGEIVSNEIPNFPIYNFAPEPVIPDSPQSSVGAEETAKCEICEMVMQYLVKVIENRKSKAEIEKALHEVCDELPKHYAQKCDKFVDEYAEIVIQLIAQDISPKQACQMMGLCDSATKLIKESVSGCALCQTVITTVESMLEDPKNQHKVDEILDKVCNYVPTSVHDKCVTLVNEYEEMIIDMIKKHGDTRKICSEIHLCPVGDFVVGIERPT